MTTERAPGSLHSGPSMNIPSRYEGMSPLNMTLAILKEHGNDEWFASTTRGRREGEEKVWVVTLYKPVSGTQISASLPYHLKHSVDFEDIKRQLRDKANEPKI